MLHLHLNYHSYHHHKHQLPKPRPLQHPRIRQLKHPIHDHFSFTKPTLTLITKCTPPQGSHLHFNEEVIQNTPETKETQGKNFWGAVSLIIGTAVGPGMLGLPAATIKSGMFPSTIVIIVCWVYVISSILLVAELIFAAMQEDGVKEVSFTGLAQKALGDRFGALVAVVYASLSFSLLVACVSGIGSIVSQWFPSMNLVLCHALFPVIVGVIIGFFPFKAIDNVNRLFCLLMLLSISALVTIGLSIARGNIFESLASFSSWRVSAILPAVPVTVLTLGFHVITPFICKLVGDSVSEARKAVLIGGSVPLVMVLSWNLIVLGLAGTSTNVTIPSSYANDPISLLLSVNPSALSAVQGFAFSALATSLIGYAVSFPKQLLDTLELILVRMNPKEGICNGCQIGRVGSITFSGEHNPGGAGRSSFNAPLGTSNTSSSNHQKYAVMLVLGVPIILGSFYRSTFSRALDFAGIYANCFLFGILPPVMAYVQQSKKKLRSSILLGGDITLFLLFIIAVILGVWH